MRKTTSRCLALLIAIVSFGLPLVVQAQRKPNATRILNNVSRAYSRLASYQDEGILVLTSEEATGGRIEKMPFKAYFKRPKLFRFEWTAQGRFDTHVFIATHGKLGQLVCMAGYTDVPKKLLVANDVDGFFRGFRDQFIKQVGGKLLSESSLPLYGHAGREMKVKMFSGELRVRLILVGDRLYQLSVMKFGRG